MIPRVPSYFLWIQKIFICLNYILFVFSFFGCGKNSLPSAPVSEDSPAVYISSRVGTAPLEVKFKLYQSGYYVYLNNRWDFDDDTEIIENTDEINHTYNIAGIFLPNITIIKNEYSGKNVTAGKICVFNENAERYEYVKTITLDYSFNDFTLNKENNIYTIDYYSNYVNVFSEEGNLIKAIQLVKPKDDSSKAHKTIYFTYTALDNKENIYVSLYDENEIQKFDKDGNFLKKWKVCDTTEAGENCENDTRYPSWFVMDKNDNLYIIELKNYDTYTEQMLFKFDSEGNFLTKLRLPSGEYRATEDIAINSAGNIYVLLSNEPIIEEYNSEGTLLKDWGEWGRTDGNFSLGYNNNIAIDNSDNFFVSSDYLDAVLKFDVQDNLVTKFGVCEKENLQLTGNIKVANDGTVYLMEEDNDDSYYSVYSNKIAVFKPSSKN